MSDNSTLPATGDVIATDDVGGVKYQRVKIAVGADGSAADMDSTHPVYVAQNGITPIVSSSAEASHVLKASAGNLFSVYAVNLTGTPGFLIILNATSAPSDGAVTLLAAVPLPPNGVAAINFAGGPPSAYSTGIVAVLTSAVTPFTKTTGVITGFISGSVQ